MLTRIPDDHVGAVVTYLEMTERPADLSIPESPLRMERWGEADTARYRALFRKVGGPWLWFSRLEMGEARLRREIGEVHEVVNGGEEMAGYIELDFSEPETCLIRFLGLAPPLAGRGHGRWLFAQTLAKAWRPGVSRVKVHTCTLDHPAALPSYLRAGFRAYARSIETFPDPRLAGLLPRDIAPQVPFVGER